MTIFKFMFVKSIGVGIGKLPNAVVWAVANHHLPDNYKY